MVLTILKNICQWEWLSHILWKIKTVPNHQPESSIKWDFWTQGMPWLDLVVNDGSFRLWERNMCFDPIQNTFHQGSNTPYRINTFDEFLSFDPIQNTQSSSKIPFWYELSWVFLSWIVYFFPFLSRNTHDSSYQSLHYYILGDFPILTQYYRGPSKENAEQYFQGSNLLIYDWGLWKRRKGLLGRFSHLVNTVS